MTSVVGQYASLYFPDIATPGYLQPVPRSRPAELVASREWKDPANDPFSLIASLRRIEYAFTTGGLTGKARALATKIAGTFGVPVPVIDQAKAFADTVASFGKTLDNGAADAVNAALTNAESQLRAVESVRSILSVCSGTSAARLTATQFDGLSRLTALGLQLRTVYVRQFEPLLLGLQKVAADVTVSGGTLLIGTSPPGPPRRPPAS